MTGSTDLSPFCPRYFWAVEIIGRRWTAAIIRALLAGTSHFSEIAAVIPGLSDRLLAERLKELEAEQIVTRTVIPETPVRIEYHLTDKGRALAGVVDALSTWAEAWLVSTGDGDASRSGVDGTAAEQPNLSAGGKTTLTSSS